MATLIPPSAITIAPTMKLATSKSGSGLSHLVYVKETAELVPARLPYHVGWPYLTSSGQMACGLGVLFSIFPPSSRDGLSGMVSLFTLLVWGPAILAAPKTRLPRTAFFISWASASAEWVHWGFPTTHSDFGNLGGEQKATASGQF